MYLENKKDSTNQLQALLDFVDALKSIFKKYTFNTREKAWDKLTSTKKGKSEIKKLIKNPERNTNNFRTLV